MAERTVIDRGPVNNIDAPSDGMFTVTPSDATDGTGDLTDGTTKQYARFLYVAGAGNVKVIFKDGSNFTFTGVAAGTLLPYATVGGSWPSFIKRVAATGTTATGISGIK